MASIKIGAVENLHGQVSVIHADGSTEVLQPGNAVYADDTVITAEDGTASIRFLDGSTYILGPDFTAILNSDIFDPAGFSQPATVDDMAQLNDSALLPGIEQPTVLSSAITDTDEILQDILEGEDPTETAEAPAAGEEVQEDSGNTFIRIAESGRAVTPDSGYETTGIGYGFTDVREELLQTPTNRAPIITADSGEVDESALAGGSGGGSDSASGQLVFDTGEDVPGVLEVQNKDGVFVEITADGTLVAGVYGDLSVDLDGSWTYVLNDNTTDHSGIDQTGTDDQVQDNFTARITDSDGDTATDALVIDINDDGPTAVTDGTIGVNEGASTAGNLLTNDTQGADSATLTHVNGEVLVFDGVTGEADVVTALGTLTVKADGSYTYAANDNSNGIDVFSYTITDADGDTAQAGISFALQDANMPTANDSSGEVDEAALADGSNAASPNESTSGALSFNPGNDTPHTLEVNGESIAGVGTTIINGTYGDLEIDIDGNWTYTLNGNTTDHTGINQTGTDDQVQDVFNFTVRDSDNDPASGNLTIDINDDGPAANSDNTATAEDTPVTINVLADDTQGADSATLLAASLNTGAGLVSFDANGDVTFTPAAGFEGDAIIDYTIRDADGDQSSAQLTVSVATDSVPSIDNDSGTVDESALPEGSGGGTDTTSGSLSLSTGDDTLAAMEINGEAIAAVGTTIINGTYGDLEIDIDGNWTYTLNNSTGDHTGINQTGVDDQVQDNFTIVITDSDGDPASGNLTIDINDDGPTAAGDSTVNIDEGSASSSVSLASLITSAGADGASVTSVNGTDLTGSGIVNVSGTHGTLVVDLDSGSFEYQANNNDAGTDFFTFTITDGDLDTDTVDYSYTVVDANEPTAGDLSRTVDEAALDTGSNSGSNNESTSGNLADLGVSFNGDEPGSLAIGAQSIVFDSSGGDSITVNGTYGDWLINDDGSWTYTLTGNTTDHSTQGTGIDGVQDVFNYTATDSDGDTANGSLTISIQDDVPTAITDPATAELRDGDTSSSGTIAALIAVAGADGASVTSVNGADLTGSGIVSVTGGNGTLVVDLDSGTYEYQANVEDTGTDNFIFTITDGDGDTDSVAVSYNVNDRPNFETESFVWLPVDRGEQSPGFEGGYPIGLNVSDLDSTLSVEITEVPDDGQAGYYDGSNTFIPLNVGDIFVLAIGESMPQVVYIPPDVDLETVDDPITDIVSFSVTEDGDPLTTQTGTININAMPPFDLPGQEAQIGDGNTPLTSGNDQEADLVLNSNLVTAIAIDINNDGVINSSFIELFTDFQERPSSGGVPIPPDRIVLDELEATVTATVTLDGVEFIVIAENDGVNQWAFDAESGLMKAVVDYNDVMSADTGVFNGSLADYLVANPPEVGDTWSVVYNDSQGGNEQARFIKFDFTYDNPGDPSISVSGDADAVNIIYGTSATDMLTGGNEGDEIHGRGGDDVLVGGGGDDIFIGGGGNDRLSGDAGADTFIIRSTGEGIDTVTDYDNNESDILDISDILVGFDPDNDSLSDFVSITSDGADATLAVDPSGSGVAYADIALLSNITAGTMVTIQVSEDTTETLIVA